MWPTSFRAWAWTPPLVGRAGRTSVVAEATAHAGAQTLLIASHLDTVPVDGMVIDPFDPVIDGDHLLGRGSCDTKAGMAPPLLEALDRVLERGRLGRNIIIVGEADEELGSQGVADVFGSSRLAAPRLGVGHRADRASLD